MTTAADARRLEEVWAAAAAARGVLPAGLEPVHERLVRAVGRAMLPDVGPAFVKLMWFPRVKDRIRYLVRALPAPHEARVLRCCATFGIRVPEVVFARGARHLGVPRLSMLATAALPVAREAPGPEAIAPVVARLVGHGVFHPDLHAGNFLRLEDGGTAVLDLQSARLSRPGLDPRRRRQMLGKLFAESLRRGEDPGALQAALRKAGLDPADVAAGAQGAAAVRRRELRGRVARCFRESTEFRVSRGLWGSRFERRDGTRGGTWVEGGPELVRYWMGDRTLALLEGQPPVLLGLYRPWPWSTGSYRLCIPGGAEALAAAADRLAAGHELYRERVR